MLSIINSNSIKYGVIASEKSKLMGEAKIVEFAYATMMANKLLQSTKFPQELKNHVRDELYALGVATIEQKWWDEIPPEENYAKFAYQNGPDQTSKFELEALKGVREMGVTATRIFVSTPGQKDNVQYFYHLSASRVQPQMALNSFVGMPATNISGKAVVKYPGSLGDSYVGRRSDPEQPQLESVFTDYQDSEKTHPYFKGKDVEKPNPVQVAHLVTFDIKSAIQSWDADLLKRYVDEMGLDIIPLVYGSDKMDPVAMNWNVVRDN